MAKLTGKEIEEMNRLMAEEDGLNNEPSDRPLTAEEEDFAEKINTQYEEAKKYGDRPVEATAEAALGAATFGLSNKLIKKLGIRTEEELRKIREYNEAASTAGTITGLAGSALIPGGQAATVGKLGKLGLGAAKTITAPARLATKAGKIVEKSIEKALLKEGSKSVVKDIVKKGAAKGVGSAVEGAAYGTGALLDEASIGAADVNAENLLSYGGLGALYGGALGTALPVAGQTLKHAGKGAKSLFGKAANKYLSPAEDAADLLGYTPKMKANALTIESEKKILNDLPDWLRTRVGWKITDNKQARLNKLIQLGKSSGNKIGQIMDNADEALKVAALDPTRKAQLIRLRSRLFNQVADDLESQVKKEFGRFAPNNPMYRKIKKPIDALRNAGRDQKNLFVANEVRQARNLISDAFKSLSREEKATRGGRILSNGYKDMARSLEEYVDFVQPGLKEQLKTANRDYHLYLKFEEPLAKITAKDNHMLNFRDLLYGTVGYGVGNMAGLAVVGARKILESDIKKKIVVLSNMEKANKGAAASIGKSITNFLDAPTAPARITAVNLLLRSTLAEDSAGKEPATKKLAFANASKKINEMAADPEELQSRIQRSTGVLSMAAPETALMATESLTRAVYFLNSKIPKPSYAGMLGKRDYEPSSMELAKFERYLQTIEHPHTVLEELKNGTITHEHVEALKAVYPNMYEELRFQTMRQIADRQEEGKPVAYNKRLQLGILLEIPTDSSLLAENLMALQAKYAIQEQEQAAQTQQGAVPQTVTGTSKLKMDERAQTETQRVVEKE